MRWSPLSAAAPAPLDLELRPSRRVRVAVLAWWCALAAAILFGTGASVWFKAGALAAAVAAGCLSGLQLGLVPSWRAPRWLRLESGRWMLIDRSGTAAYVQLCRPPLRAGPLIFLGFRHETGVTNLVLDAAVMEPTALRAIKAGLKLNSEAQGSRDRNC